MGITPSQWERVKELYEEALGCSPAYRTAFLQQTEPDAQVRWEVERLLREQEKLGSFLSTPLFAETENSTRQAKKRMAPGEMLAGRFRILGFIAAGGMGEVYKAEDTRLDRIVALKFLPTEFAEDREALERLRREAKAASALNHPNICTVYDLGEDAGGAFIAMEYLEGETLSTRIKRGPLPVDEALKIAMAVAGALSMAHRKGIIHRDLKPGNIMLTDTGTILLDFGLAKYDRPLAVEEETLTVLTRDAHVVGTLPYMSPEQLHGEEVDARGDIFAFGAVLYEMITGKRAFQRKSNSETVLAVDSEEPGPIHEFVKDTPDELERIIRHCLRKRPEERYVSMLEIERELEDCALASGITGGINLRALILQGKRPRILISLVVILLMIGAGAAWWLHRSAKVRWARNEALPQIAKLAEQEKFGEAYALAVQAERYIPHDPMLVKYWDQISWTDTIATSPSGVSVYRRNYNAPDSAWEFLGQSPIEKGRFPLVDSRWKFENKGYATVERTTTVDRPTLTLGSLTLTMVEENKVPAGMVRVELATPESKSTPVHFYGLPGYDTLPPVPLTDFWIDKFEVTNAEYKRFVDQEGYQRKEYWKQEFRKDGRALSWDQAIKLFVDKTGRAGPATWIQGAYPRGQDNYPVTGVSWFEAAAYAEFVGKSLPTMYHWRVAALPTDSPNMIPASNFGGSGPAPVGRYQGMSWSGAFDMAGNVKEWIWNEATPGKRYILGGAWNEPTYTFNDPDARSPFARSATFGFRCALYALTGESAKAADPVMFQARDYSSEKPVSDQLFQVYRSLYSYDKTPLRTVVESSQQTDDWKLEKITYDAAYGNERITAYLFLPKKGKPPFQTVVYFPGAAALIQRSSENNLQLEAFNFIVNSGRAVMFSVYKGTFERWNDFNSKPKDSSFYRDEVIAWSKDLGRSVDYLETRNDIDRNKLAYEGYSWGAAMGAILPAMEARFKALVLIGPGFWLQKRFPAADQINFAPRVKAPVLMLNGRFDFIFPTASSQEPMFRLLGTPNEHKRRVVYDSGHDIPRNEMIKESLNWLDRYLGPVK
jgi:formylglycine-generating enzyme required for sulfatase activity/cephalosporin-C deacetylase-like acetyl esterase/predicted Ser/Thr protein kinase